MLKLLDGPVEGVYMCKRAPLFLRAVVDKKTGEKDALDQLDDKPKATEQLFIYRLQGEAGWVHLKMTKRSESGFYALGEYRYLQSIDGEALREKSAWQQWASAQVGGKVDLETGAMKPELPPVRKLTESAAGSRQRGPQAHSHPRHS